MESWVRFSAQTQAKERLFRACQYACTLLGYTLQKSGTNAELIATIKKLEAHMSLGRKYLEKLVEHLSDQMQSNVSYLVIEVFEAVKQGLVVDQNMTDLSYSKDLPGAGLPFHRATSRIYLVLDFLFTVFRLGNSVDALESAKRAIHLSDIVLRFCITVSNLNRAMYFACDNILWIGKAGLAPEMDQEKWSQRSFRYYLFALIMNLSRDAYEIKLLMERETSRPRHKGFLVMENGSMDADDGVDEPLAQRLRIQLLLIAHVLKTNPPLLLDVLKNGCDLFIPLDKLRLFRTNPGFVGLCGLTSSILSILSIVHPWLKLKP